MRPGNNSLFLGQNKPMVSFHPQTRLGEWKEMQHLNTWFSYETYNWCSKWHITWASQEMTFSADKWRRNFNSFSQRSSSEFVPDIRNGMKIFSPVSGWMMACVRRAWHLLHAVRSPEASAFGGYDYLRPVNHLPAWSSGLPTTAQARVTVKYKKYN